jgi:hypothetical protein
VVSNAVTSPTGNRNVSISSGSAWNLAAASTSASRVSINFPFEGLGLRGLGFAQGVALNLGPVLRDTVEAAYHTLRLRGGSRRPVQAAQFFLVTVIANGVRYGDDVVQAASARAFDPAARPARVPPILGRIGQIHQVWYNGIERHERRLLFSDVVLRL